MLQKENADNLEVVELIKDAISSRRTGSELEFVLKTSLASQGGALTRRINGEPLFLSIARHCIFYNEINAICLLVKGFFCHRDLARSTHTLKKYLLANVVNDASVAGLFELPLSRPEIVKICRNIQSSLIPLGIWAENGLKYDKWIEYCENVITEGKQVDIDPNFVQKVEHAVKSLGIKNRECNDAGIDPRDVQFSNIGADQLYSIKNMLPLPFIGQTQWECVLTNKSYHLRCIAAELVGVYVASGRHQDATVRMLLGAQRKIPSETYLRAVSYSCIALAKKSKEAPARSTDTVLSQQHDVVLPLTQQQQRTPKKPQDVASSQNNAENGVWSYLNCFQGQCLLYLSLFDAFRDEESVALFAAHQFRLISRSLGKTPWQICQPFWPWIAPKVLKHYNEKFVDWFCETVLQVSRQDFLMRTVGITIPHLCHAGKEQIKACEDIAEFRGCSIRRLYIDNAAAIIAMFLMRSSSEVEQAWAFAEDRFMSIDRSFRTLRFNQILASWRVDAIFEVLMLTTDKNASLATGIINKIMDCAYAQQEDEHRELLQQTIFKLIVKFSETMRNIMGRQSESTKLSALTGLKVLISRFLEPELIASVLRQLTAFLQAALENPLLSLASLQVWLAVVNNLEIMKLESIVDLTYAIINERVDTWDKESVNCARDIVMTIKHRLKDKAGPCRIHPQSVFDYPYDETDSSANNEGHAPYDILFSLVTRDTENTHLAQQTARDLCAFSLEYQDEILSWAQTDGPGHELLGRAIRVLLVLCSKHDLDLKMLSARALGLFGALDPHKTPIDSKESSYVMVFNFQKANEVVDFSRILVQDWFLPAFEAAIDPAVQRYFAYGIQELLKFMGVEEENKVKLLFKDEGIVSTLLPLVKTKYTTDMKHWTPPSYPIFNPTRPYNEWLVIFCSDMMGRTLDPEYATRIFTWCRKVLYGSNVGPEMWAFLFPYAALAAVVDKQESKVNRSAFISEVLLVLGTAGDHMQPFHERIFAVFDYFNQWMRSRRQAKQSLMSMDTLLAKIPARIMAQRALECGAYPRAIRYYEQQVREEPLSEPDVLQSLRQIYAAMQDVDSLEGVSSRMPTLSLEQQVLEYRATSQWDAALACYNALPANDATLAETLECLHRNGREKSVLAELSSDRVPIGLAPVGAECAWFVRDWKALEKWTSLINNDTTAGNQLPNESAQALGYALLHLNNENWEGFKHSLETGRKFVGIKLGDIVSTHHITSLRQVRELMVYLHGLADMESLGTMVMPENLDERMLSKSSTALLVKEQLDARLSVLSPLSEGPEFEARRYLLSLRAAALSCVEKQFPAAMDLVAEAHLSVSSEARHHGQHSIALMEITAAKFLNNSKADIEHAHLLWSKGESRSAIRMLQSKIPLAFFDKPKLHSKDALNALDWTTWRDITAQADTRVIVDNYQAVTKSLPKCSEAQYRLAKHYVKIYDESPQSIRNDGMLNKAIVHHFSKALELGTPKASEALPKMLTTWFELGIIGSDLSPQEASSRKHSLSQINKEIQTWARIIDKKLVYTAIPQLLSRHNHPSKPVKNLIEHLIILVLRCYPHHTLWPVLEKGENVQQILEEATAKVVKSEQLKFSNLIKMGADLAEKLKRICALKPKPKEVKLADLGEDFEKCLDNPSLAVPVQKTMDGLENILIYRIEERVVVQQSLQRPKRIVVWGTDGNQYQLLLKGNDDVRKDARLIEFTTAVNQLLKADPTAAWRHLDILTYRVTPLGANAGIIEWVTGAIPVRSIMYSLSRSPNLGLGSAECKKMTNTSTRMSDRLNAFFALQKEVPPVLWEWFVDTFPDPEAWLDARTRYARSLAVMSMIGYILGLGDRHLENILLIQNTGAVLHVDFDCLFDKGRHLAVPELVPFRLTQQFQDALGVVNRYEGPFRKVSELTLKIVRANEDLLMVVLEAFIHDPVVQDRINLMQPRQTMERLRAKIRGIREPNSVPLSVGGLVDDLIQVAVSPDNLCQLFKGWMPWI